MEVLCYSASNIHCSNKVHNVIVFDFYHMYISGNFAQRVGMVLSCRIHVTSCCGYVLRSGAHG